MDNILKDYITISNLYESLSQDIHKMNDQIENIRYAVISTNKALDNLKEELFIDCLLDKITPDIFSEICSESLPSVITRMRIRRTIANDLMKKYPVLSFEEAVKYRPNGICNDPFTSIDTW